MPYPLRRDIVLFRIMEEIESKQSPEQKSSSMKHAKQAIRKYLQNLEKAADVVAPKKTMEEKMVQMKKNL